ncbi:MAG TPA: PstS family phosphate ABC transporter substrate-binding protein [Oscillospiraceae bacterium]|nr:PstS family phosphate ABC transporter substrate-binding protein [Oscillospiraceae bacterium]
MNKNLKLFVWSMSVLVVLGSLVGCGSQGDTHGNDIYEIKGSDSEVNLVTALVEAYAKGNNEVEFSVTGGGSGTGIAALINNQTDVANSSRQIKEQEVTDAKAQGVEPVPIVFAMDGVAIIVNADNNVKQLTVTEIGNIFAGEITNWKEVGGPDQEITLYGRQSSSGTFSYVMERVVKNDYAQSMKQMNGNSEIVESVANDKSAIGYVALGYIQDATGIKALGVSEDGTDPYVNPSDYQRVKNGEYVLTRPLYQYFNGLPSGALREYVEFELSTSGQELVGAEGFLPVTETYRQENEKYLK